MPASAPSSITTKLKQHHDLLVGRFQQKHTTFLDALKRKTLEAQAVGSVLLLLNPGQALLPGPSHLLEAHAEQQVPDEASMTQELVAGLTPFVPTDGSNLSPEQEWHIAEFLSKKFKFGVAGELEGKRLPRTIGMIGGEQHLYRFPGDTLEQHADLPDDADMFLPSGIAPGLGAWGHFAPSQADMTEEIRLRERYYLAVQTFMIPDYHERLSEYRDFFKFRKMVVVNPATGQGVVAVVGDAGPAPWTGKHLGGSPEVMHAVGLAEGPRKGNVLLFFVDDPENKVPLGPIHFDRSNG